MARDGGRGEAKWGGAKLDGWGLSRRRLANWAQDWSELSRHRPGQPGACTWAGPPREASGTGGAVPGLRLFGTEAGDAAAGPVCQAWAEAKGWPTCGWP